MDDNKHQSLENVTWGESDISRTRNRNSRKKFSLEQKAKGQLETEVLSSPEEKLSKSKIVVGK